AHAGVEKDRLFRPQDEVGNSFFSLVRLVDRERPGSHFVHFKPRIADGNAHKRSVFRPRERLAPVRNCLGLRCQRGRHRTKQRQPSESVAKAHDSPLVVTGRTVLGLFYYGIAWGACEQILLSSSLTVNRKTQKHVCWGRSQTRVSSVVKQRAYIVERTWDIGRSSA